MGSFTFRRFTFLLIIVFFIWSSSMETCNARRGKHWRHSRGVGVSLFKKKGKHNGSSYHHGNAGKAKKKTPSPQAPPPPGPPPSPAPAPAPSPSPSPSTPSLPTQPPSPPQRGHGNAPSTTIFNVLDFGAKGDGDTDDTKAFQAAWAAACKVEASTIIVPSESVFLVGPISFSGPYCQHNIVFQLDGTIIAPTNAHSWGSGILQWLEFTKLVGITIQGSGTIDGKGAVWWQDSPLEDLEDNEAKLIVPLNSTVGRNPSIPIKGSLGGNMPSIKPTALRFYGSFNVTVTGITIQNSPQCHLKFDNCIGVSVYNFSVSSPGDSPNTDGIHLQNSRDVLIRSSNVACGNAVLLSNNSSS